MSLARHVACRYSGTCRSYAGERVADCGTINSEVETHSSRRTSKYDRRQIKTEHRDIDYVSRGCSGCGGGRRGGWVMLIDASMRRGATRRLHRRRSGQEVETQTRRRTQSPL